MEVFVATVNRYYSDVLVSCFLRISINFSRHRFCCRRSENALLKMLPNMLRTSDRDRWTEQVTSLVHVLTYNKMHESCNVVVPIEM